MIDINDGRQCFYESWVRESPARTFGSMSWQEALDQLTTSMTNNSASIKNITPNIYCLIIPDAVYIYYKDNINIKAIVQLEPKPDSLNVIATNKDPAYKGQSPYITDLYIAALSVTGDKSIRLSSDNVMTDEGFGIWQRLFNQGHIISVYDSSNFRTLPIKITNLTDLKQYFNDGFKYKNYRFAISENLYNSEKIFGQFMVRRTRELAGIVFDEDYE